MAQRREITTGGADQRLQALIRERLQPGADKARIDQRIWDLFGEDWCVMFTDLSGFSRRVAEFGIIHFLQTIIEAETILVPVIDQHDGILLRVEGDSMLVIFRTAPKALQCALAMQRATIDHNQNRSPEECVLLCVGLGCGRMLRVGDENVYGAEVNAASKLGEDRARAGEILVTGNFRDQCRDLPGIAFEPLPQPPAGCQTAWKVVLASLADHSSA